MSNINLSTQKAIQEVKNLIGELNVLDDTLKKISKGNVNTFAKLTTSMNSLYRVISDLNKNLDRLANITKTNSKRLTKNSNELKRNADLTKTNSKNVRGNTTAKNANSKAIKANTKSLNNNAKAQDKNKKSGMKLMGTIRELAGHLGFMGLVAAIALLIKNTLDLTVRFQSLKYALDQTSLSVFESGRSMQFLIDLNNKFGADMVTTTERWLKFRTAARQSGLTLLETKKIFESVTKASAVLGLRTDELKGVYLALEQMLSKGKITTEELRRQLGERLPGAMGIMANAMGVTLPQLDKMMKKGEVLSAEVLPAFAEELERAYNIENINNVTNLATAVGKLTGQWEQLIITITEGDSLFTKGIGYVLGSLEKFLSKLNIFLMDFDQTARAAQGSFNKKIFDEYEGRANDIINKTKEFANTEAELLTVRTLYYKQYRKAQEDGDKEVERTAQNKIAQINEEIRLINLRKDVLMQTDAVTRLQGEVKETSRLKKELEDAGEATLDFFDKNKQLGDLLLQLTPATFFDNMTEYQRLLATLTPKQKEYVEQLEREAVTRELAEKGSDVNPIPVEEGLKRRIKYAKEYNGSVKDAILVQKQLADNAKRIFNQERQSYDDLEDAVETYYVAVKAGIELRKKDELTKVGDQEQNELNKWESVLTGFKKGSDRYNEQYIEYEKAITNIKLKYTDKREAIQVKYNNEEEKNEQQKYNNLIALAQKEQALLLRIENETKDYNVGEIDQNLQNAHTDTIKYGQLLRKRNNLLIDHENNKIQIRQNALRKMAKIAREEGEIDIALSYEQTADSLEKLKLAYEKVTFSATDYMRTTRDFMVAIQGLGDALFERKISQIDEEIAAEEKKYDRLLELAKNDEEEQKIIERNRKLRIEQLEEARKKEQVKQAKFNKALSINQSLINTSMAVTSALSQPTPMPYNIAMAAIAGALGALEVATIAATPIPQFKDGGTMKYDGKALINDGGKQEYVERDGKLLTTTKTDALVNLKKDDVIHKDFETLQKNSMLFSLVNGGGDVTEQQFNQMFFGISDEIEKGFKKAKISNKVTVLNEDKSYRDKMLNWN